jgi:hypothetical protein
MRKISWKTLPVIAVAGLVFGAPQMAFAQSNENVNYNNTSNNLSGFSLPNVQLPQGSDEVRAADGTACRSAVSGDGAYVDVGVMGNPYTATGNTSASVYGRVVVPLNAPRSRIDCTQLYTLEIERLKTELQRLKMGLGGSSLTTGSIAKNGANEQKGGNWAEQGWSNKGRHQQ